MNADNGWNAREGAPGASALLVVDVQRDYFPSGRFPLPGSERATLKAKEAISIFRRRGGTVINIQHVADDAGASFFIRGTGGVEIHADVKPLDLEKLIVKSRPDGFQGTGLEEYLRGKGIGTVVVCGMQTDVCVRATCARARALAFDAVVIDDACAALTPERHRAALRAMAGAGAVVIPASRLDGVLIHAPDSGSPSRKE